MFLRQIKDWINTLSEDQLDYSGAVYDDEIGEAFTINGVDIVKGENHVLAGVLDENSPIFVIKFKEEIENPILYE